MTVIERLFAVKAFAPPFLISRVEPPPGTVTTYLPERGWTSEVEVTVAVETVCGICVPSRYAAKVALSVAPVAFAEYSTR